MKNKKESYSGEGELKANQSPVAVSVILKLKTKSAPLPATAPASTAPANTEPLLGKPKRRPRVALEPELEEIAALWSAAKRFEMARKFGRWSRQLRISGFILFHESHRQEEPVLPFLGLRKARLN